MPQKITWTTEADAAIAALRAGGATWDRVAASLGVSRNAALERARILRAGTTGKPPPSRIERPGRSLEPDAARPPLPPGHPVAWAVLVENTCLAGAAYPAPDFSDRAFRRAIGTPASERGVFPDGLACGPCAHGTGGDRSGGGLKAACACIESLENKQ